MKLLVSRMSFTGTKRGDKFCTKTWVQSTGNKLELDLSAEWGMANLGREGVMFKLPLFGLSNFGAFHDRPQFTQMPKATGTNSGRNIPGAPRNILGAANSLPGYERC